MNHIQQFGDAISAAGITPPEGIRADGELHRFSSNGKGGDKAGWYILHDDGIPAGRFGCWRSGISKTWRANIGRNLTHAEEIVHQKRMTDMREKRAKEKAYRHKEAERIANTRWEKAQSEQGEHAYLRSKGVKAYRIKTNGLNLIIPLRDTSGILHSLQTITPQGNKMFLPGGRVQGCYHAIGDPSDVLCIAEGYSTAASIHEATGLAVAVAFNAGNLEPVAKAIRLKYPNLKLILCADDDHKVNGNPGISKAIAAAQAVDGLVAIPDFGDEHPDGATDFNDMATQCGLDEVAEVIKRASAPLDPGSRVHASESPPLNEIVWGKPGAIEERLKSVPSLPDEIIPEPFRAWIIDISHRMQTPPDFAAVTAMVATASIIGAGCTIRPKQLDDWSIPPNLWGACIGRPSVVLKSPSMKEAMNMLDRLQAAEKEAHDVAMKNHSFNALVSDEKENVLKKQIKNAATSKNQDLLALEALRDDYQTFAPEPEPTRKLFKTNETSVQSQTVLQVDNPRGILTFRDELTGLLTRWDRPEHEDERAYFLEGWNGDGSYTDFKIGRGLTEAPRICISLFGGIQPDKLKRYLHQSMHGGNDGMMQRFQLAVYPDEPAAWKLIDMTPDVREKNRVFDLLKTLANADFTEWGAAQEDNDKLPYMRFSEQGQQVFNKWILTLQNDTLRDEDNPLVVEHLGKFRSLMPSLALVIHLIDIADGSAVGPVSKQSALMAAAWCDYLEAHARRIYGIALSPEREAASILADRIRVGKLPDPFTAKDVYKNGWHMLKGRVEVEAACAVLEEEYWLYKEHTKPPRKQGGRPPLERYLINPALYEGRKNNIQNIAKNEPSKLSKGGFGGLDSSYSANIQKKRAMQ